MDVLVYRDAESAVEERWPNKQRLYRDAESAVEERGPNKQRLPDETGVVDAPQIRGKCVIA